MIWRLPAALVAVGLLRALTALADETLAPSVTAPPAAPFCRPSRSETLGEAGILITHRRLQVPQLAGTRLDVTPPTSLAPLQRWAVALASAIISRCWTPTTSAGEGSLELRAVSATPAKIVATATASIGLVQPSCVQEEASKPPRLGTGAAPLFQVYAAYRFHASCAESTELRPIHRPSDPPDVIEVPRLQPQGPAPAAQDQAVGVGVGLGGGGAAGGCIGLAMPCGLWPSSLDGPCLEWRRRATLPAQPPGRVVLRGLSSPGVAPAALASLGKQLTARILPELEQCYDFGLRKDPRLTGSLAVRVTFDAKIACVHDVRNAGSVLSDSLARTCATDRFYNLDASTRPELLGKTVWVEVRLKPALAAPR